MTGAVPLSHLLLRERLRPGDRVVDATCGTGRDTLFLARAVGADGKVWAFDVQEQALSATRNLLEQEGRLSSVELVAAGHERLADFVQAPIQGAMFNLGYLPGGDKSCITSPGTTVAALGAAAALLAPSGLITVALYPGHCGGEEECRQVAEWGSGLSPQVYNVWQSVQLNRSAAAPYLVVVEKRGAGGRC